jgi:hypothetical protein
MKMLNQSSGTSSSSSSTPAATTPATPSPIAAPSLSGGNATATATGGDGLTDPDAVPTPQSGQLLAFGLFRSKDPFVQQLRAGASGASGATGEPGPTGASGPTGAGGLTGGGVPPSGGSEGGTGGGSSPATPAPAVTTAVISVDGTPETVKVGAQFPAASPVFTLLSLTKTAAKISIAGGSLENGAPAVTLTKKKPLTLLNTADGTRYVLRLISVS